MEMFHFKDTPENRAYADAIKETMKRKADLAKAGTTLMKSKAALPWLLGCSAFVLCAGVGGGVALWGYSYITGNKVIAGQVAESVKAVLDTEVITAKLADGGEVALAKGAQVRIDPDSVLRVSGTISADTPRPQPEQVRQDERPASQAAPAPAEYWVFNEVPFTADQVETGAVFNDGQLTRQYCQYVQPAHAPIRTFTTIGHDGRMDLPAAAPAGVTLAELRAAFASCVWRGSAVAVAPVAPAAPVQTILIHAPKR
jgi:hypothetical protein